MATFLTSRPFTGVRQMKYEKMLAETPEAVRAMSRRDLEGHLTSIEERYRDRTMELLPSCLERMGATEELKASDWGEYHRACEQGQRMAREVALAEVLEAGRGAGNGRPANGA